MATLLDINAPGSLDLAVWEGGEFYHTLIWFTDSTLANRIDLTGWSFELDARDGMAQDATLLFTLTDGAGIDVSGIADGELILSKSAVEMEALDFEIAYYTMRGTPPAGAARRKVLLEGTIPNYRGAAA